MIFSYHQTADHQGLAELECRVLRVECYLYGFDVLADDGLEDRCRLLVKDERCFFQMPPGGELPVFRGCYRHVGGNPASGLLACRVTDGGNLLSAPERQTGLENNIGIAACVYHPNGHQSTSEYFGCHAAFLPRKQAIHTGGPTLRRSNCLYVHGDDALVRLLQQGVDQ